MNKKINIIIAFIGIVFGVFFSNKTIEKSINTDVIKVGLIKNNNIFKTEFKKKSINLYTIKRTFNDSSFANKIANNFGIFNFNEDYEKYQYNNGNELLTIYKNRNYINYSTTKKDNNDIIIDKEKAMKLSLKFIKDKNITFDYEEALVNIEDNLFVVKFMKRLGNYKNFGFPNIVKLDLYGNIVLFDYYFFEYNKLSNITYNGITNFDLPFNASKIDGYEIVYVYQNSILQPVYLVTGKTDQDKIFEFMVSPNNIK